MASHINSSASPGVISKYKAKSIAKCEQKQTKTKKNYLFWLCYVILLVILIRSLVKTQFSSFSKFSSVYLHCNNCCQCPHYYSPVLVTQDMGFTSLKTCLKICQINYQGFSSEIYSLLQTEECVFFLLFLNLFSVLSGSPSQ